MVEDEVIYTVRIEVVDEDNAIRSYVIDNTTNKDEALATLEDLVEAIYERTGNMPMPLDVG